MKTEVGVWIDHRKAVIASIAGKKEAMRRVTSSGAPRGSAGDQREGRFTGHLDKYYDEVIACVRHADSIFILGPGEAKIQFQERLGAEGLHRRVVGIETVDRMTGREVAARVRERFLESTNPLQG